MHKVLVPAVVAAFLSGCMGDTQLDPDALEEQPNPSSTPRPPLAPLPVVEGCTEDEDDCDEEPEDCLDEEECAEENLNCLPSEEGCEEELEDCVANDEDCEAEPEECTDDEEDCGIEVAFCEDGAEDCESDEEDCAQNRQECAGTGIALPAGAIDTGDTRALNLPQSPLTLSGLKAAARFAEQATLGLTPQGVQQLADQGFENWIDTQMALPRSRFRREALRAENYLRQLSLAEGEDGEVEPSVVRSASFFHQLMTADDLLRMRVALALSEILVVSSVPEFLEDSPTALPVWLDLLSEHAFGSYYELLYQASINPAMGVFLSSMYNRKADPASGRFPDENYAREVMQLFSIGLVELRSDGSPRLDAAGRTIPSYSNADITEMARVFTGLVPGDIDNPEDELSAEELDPGDMDAPMRVHAPFHDSGAKSLLGSLVIAAGQDGLSEIRQATDFLVDHPNTAPFLALRMIQRLVTSNPSPGFVRRAAARFRSSGMNLGELVKAILLDNEARQQSADSSFGRMQEPMVRFFRLLRGVGLRSSTGLFYGEQFVMQETINQFPLNSPSVFNFFQPGFAPNNAIGRAQKLAPEFQILNANTLTGWGDLLFEAVLIDLPLGFEFGEGQVQLSLSDELEAYTSGGTEALLDLVAFALGDGELSPATRQAITQTVNELSPQTSATERVQIALYLLAMAPDVVIAN